VGGIGRYVVDDLHRQSIPYLAVERDPSQVELVERILGHSFPFVIGDASDDAVLEQAGIKRARGLFTTFDNDKMNVFVTLSARRLNLKMHIVSRAADTETVAKLKRAGADTVVSTNFIGGMRVSSEMIRPHVVEFLDIVLKSRDRPMLIEEVTVGADSPEVGTKVSDPRLRSAGNALIMAVRDTSTGDYQFNPPGNRVLVSGDTLVVMGLADEIASFRLLFEPIGPPAGGVF
jgi:voltage-gated potassium channel